ncbi:MAG: hypothetical protein FD189_762 [Elusimicrobia bacterium]|nr:MAG: hypothetical protein FD154_693 [Elusimicrobiota bacterium]KAF0157008.1 MAG: hypothetical protein FD189_762 [Elusimicrobiota bacterium]
MNICILSTTTEAHLAGGSEMHCRLISEGAAADGHRVTLLTTRHPEGKAAEEKNGVRTLYLDGTDHSMSVRWAARWRLKSLEKLRELHAASRFDVLWAENLSGWHCSASRSGLALPLVTIMNGPGVRDGLRSEFNRVSTAGELAVFAVKILPQTLLFYLPWFYHTVKGADALIAVSPESANSIKAEFSFAAAKLHTVYNGIDVGLFRPDPPAGARTLERYGFSGAWPVLLMAGVLHKQKGFHLGLEAFRRIRDKISGARLLIAGDGPERASLESLSVSSGLAGTVAFCGHVPQPALPEYYNACDLFLNPTLRVEGHPLVALEALACGKPVVTAAIGGTLSTIVDGENGFFFKPGDVDAMTEKCLRLFADRNLLAAMSASARSRALSKFSVGKMVREYLRISAVVIDSFKGTL